MLWFGQNSAASTLLLYFHGNACDLGQIASNLEAWHRATQFQVVAFEYPGYGTLSAIKATERGLVEHVQHAMRSLMQHPSFEHVREIVLVGQSLGAAAALCATSFVENELAPECHAVGDTLKLKIGGLVLVSPFASLQQMAQHACSERSSSSCTGKLAEKLVSHRLDNTERIATITCPCLLIHGTEDAVVPFVHSEWLYDACSEKVPKRLVPLRGVGHNISMNTILELGLEAQRLLCD